MPLPQPTIDLLSAACVGLNQALVGHPLDTVKTLLQTNKRWAGFPLARYYRGVAYPLAAGVGFNAAAFSVYEDARRRWGSAALAGCLSGLAVVPVVTVSEGAKIARQTGLAVTPGVVVRGAPATLLRETTAMTAYFGTYAHLREEHGVGPCVAGAACGLAGWTVSYPSDVVRSRQVALGVGFREAWAMGRLWRGFGACAARAVVVNGTNLGVYEGVRGWLGGVEIEGSG